MYLFGSSLAAASPNGCFEQLLGKPVVVSKSIRSVSASIKKLEGLEGRIRGADGFLDIGGCVSGREKCRFELGSGEIYALVEHPVEELPVAFRVRQLRAVPIHDRTRREERREHGAHPGSGQRDTGLLGGLADPLRQSGRALVKLPVGASGS